MVGKRHKIKYFRDDKKWNIYRKMEKKRTKKRKEKQTQTQTQTDTETHTDADRHGNGGHEHRNYLNSDVIDFSDFIDFSNLNVWHPCPHKSAGVGEEPFRTHSGKSHCVSGMAPAPSRGFFKGRGARLSNVKNQLNRKMNLI